MSFILTIFWTILELRQINLTFDQISNRVATSHQKTFGDLIFDQIFFDQMVKFDVLVKHLIKSSNNLVKKYQIFIKSSNVIKTKWKIFDQKMTF